MKLASTYSSPCFKDICLSPTSQSLEADHSYGREGGGTGRSTVRILWPDKPVFKPHTFHLPGCRVYPRAKWA